MQFSYTKCKINLRDVRSYPRMNSMYTNPSKAVARGPRFTLRHFIIPTYRSRVLGVSFAPVQTRLVTRYSALAGKSSVHFER